MLLSTWYYSYSVRIFTCFFFRKKKFQNGKMKKKCPFIMHKCVRIRSSRHISYENVDSNFKTALGTF